MKSKKVLFGIAVLSSALLIAACDGNTPSISTTPAGSTSSPISSTIDGTTPNPTTSITPTTSIAPSTTVTPSTTVSPSTTITPSSSVVPSPTVPIADKMEGKGTVDEPYLIGNVNQLKDFAEYVNAGTSTQNTYYCLTHSIDMTGVKWEAAGTIENPFTGYFIGNGHAIENLTFDTFKASQSLIGFLGYGVNAVITDLEITGLDVELSVLGKGSQVYIGGVIAYGTNVYVDGVDVEIENFKVESYQNGNSQVVAGGIASFLGAADNIAVSVQNSSVTGDIIFDMSNAADTVSAAAGIVAMTSTSFGSGILAINNCLYNGNLSCGTYAAGIVADIDVYCSIVNCIAMGESITATDTEGCYAAGIVNGTSYETAVIGNYSNYETISAAISTSIYKSYAADVVSLPTADGYSEDSDIRGTAIYNNYVAQDLNTTADRIVNNGTAAAEDAALYSDKLGLSNKVWNLPFNAENPFVAEMASYEVEVTFDTQDAGIQNSKLEIIAGDYSGELAQKIETDTYEKTGYSYYGYTYDKEGKIEARWYAPVNANMTLYAGWASLADLIGTYAYVCIFYGSPIGDGGYFIFDEETFTWINNSSYDVYAYEYTFNGNYIFIGDTVGLLKGSYEGSVFIFNSDKTITGFDLNDSDAVYTATRTSSPVEIPDFTGSKFLGEWYNDTLKLTILSDGNAYTRKYTSEADYYGGYRVNSNNTITLSVFGGYSNSAMSYFEAQDVLIGSDGTVFTRETPNARFATTDGSLIVVVTNSKDYVIVDGTATDLEIEGGLADGSVVTIDGVTYAVNGTTLTEEVVVEEKFYVGTWEGKIGMNNTTVVLNADGTAVYNGTACTYTASGNVLTIELGGGSIIVTLTYDEANDKISAHYEDDDYNEFDGTLTRVAVDPDDPGETVTYVGTWEGKIGMNNTTVVLNADGTAVYNGTACTYTVSGNVLTIELGGGSIIVTLTYDEANDKISAHYEDDDYNEFNGTLTRVAVDPEPDPEPEPVGPTVESVAGTYSGVWGSASVACSIVLKSDKTGVITAGDTVINFTWDVDLNGKITTVVTSVVSGSEFDDLTLTYVSKDGVVTITGSIVQDYDYAMNISVTRQGDEPTNPEDPTAPGYVGTWTGKVGANNTTVVLNADGTGSYNGTACTYTVNGNVITIELGGGSIIITLTYDESTDKISAHYEDDDYNEFDGTLTR